MDAVGAWVKSLIFLVIFAAFIELLLPNRTMRSFVRVMIGFCVLLAILQPITELKNAQQLWLENSFSPTIAARSQNSFAAAQAQREKLVQRAYCKQLEQQINVLLQKFPEVAAARSAVTLKNTEKTDEAQQIERIQLWIQPQSLSGEKISICLQENKDGKGISEELKNKIVRQISELYQIPREHILIEQWR